MKKEKLLNAIERELSGKHTQDTTSSYMYAIKRFMDQYPNAQRLKLTDIEGYFLQRKIQGDGVGYRTATLAAIKAMYDCFIEFGLIKEHPCKTYRIKEKKPTGKDFGEFLTMEEMEVLLNLKEERYKYVGNRNKAMISLLIYQGITSKELVELSVSNVNLDEGTIRIKGQGKNKGRTIGLKPNQIIMLMRYIEEDRPHLLKGSTNKLFLGMRGAVMTTDALHEFIHRLSGAFDKEVSPMNLRNSVISHWLNVRKIPLEDVQVMAGHRYPSTTEKYIKPDEKQQREAVSRLHQSIFG